MTNHGTMTAAVPAVQLKERLGQRSTVITLLTAVVILDQLTTALVGTLALTVVVATGAVNYGGVREPRTPVGAELTHQRGLPSASFFR